MLIINTVEYDEYEFYIDMDVGIRMMLIGRTQGQGWRGLEDNQTSISTHVCPSTNL